MFLMHSPQSWKRSASRRRRQALKSYRPLAERPQRFKTRRLGQPTGFKKLLHAAVKLIVVVLILGGVALAGAVAWYSRELPKNTDLLTKQPLTSTKIYDRTGQIMLNDVNADFRRVKISLKDLPEYVKWSAIVAEDRQFYSHHGINFKGILRALFSNVFRSTKVGGSSISQQFVKNALLSPEKTYTRKLKEAILTWQLESKFTKDEILEMYFNEIPYGGTAYGIEAAANKYFGKAAKDLTLAEAAALAALPQAPSYYSPYGANKDKLLVRKDWVLDALVSEGYLSEPKVAAAKKQILNFKNISSDILAPHFVFYVRELVAEKYGEDMLEKGGLKIITTLNMDQQKIAEEVIKAGVEKNKEKFNARNAALVALNPETSEVTAMVGSVNYFDTENDGAVNVALSPRQPGSSFKPVVYSAAFAKGYTPDTMLFDVLTTFKAQPEDYTPHNYNDKFNGPVSIRQALAGSLNVPAVKTMYLVGVENVLNLAEQLGYTTFADRSRFGLSVVLGGGEVKLLEHTNTFATLANEGQYKAPLVILEITDKDGKTLEKNNPQKNKKKKVLEPQVARLVTSILSDNNARAYVFGANNYLTLADRPVAAKTGTTNDFKDAWTIGYTPTLACGVWTGNTRGEVMKGAADGSAVAAPIWREFMQRVFKETKEKPDNPTAGWEVKKFTEPDKYELPDKTMLNGKFFEEIKVRLDKNTSQPATNSTPSEQIEEKTFRVVHNILHYVNKNNPLGPLPDKPWEQDENYNNWETAVEKWAQENGYDSQVPGGENNWQNSVNRPSILINTPTDGADFNTADISVIVSASAKQGLRQVEYYIDSQLVATVNNSPFNLINFKLVGFANGEHTLKAVAVDNVDQRGSDQIKINLNLSNNNPTTILNPSPNAKLYDELFPLPVEVSVANYEYYKKLDFYLYNKKDDTTKWLGFLNVNQAQMVFTWEDAPARGSYGLYILTTDRYGNTVKSGETNIEKK